MKYSPSRIAWIGGSILISLMFASGASAQSSAGLLWAYRDNPDNGSMARASVVVFNRATNVELKRFQPGANWGGVGCIFGRGIAYDPRDGNLWVTMNRGSCSTPSGGTRGDGFIHKINSWDGSDLGTIPDPTNTSIGPLPSLGAMDYDAQDNALYGASAGAVCYEFNAPCRGWVYKLNADTGSVIWKTQLPAGINGSHILALERDAVGTKLLNVNYGYLNTDTGAIVKPLVGGLNPIDIDEITGQEVQALVGNVTDVSIQDGRCDCVKIQPPPSQNISTGWPFDLSGVDPNWSMFVQVTDNDGLTLRNIKLGQRYMIEKISVPYYFLETTAFPRQRGQLRPDGTESSLRSRLVNYYTAADDKKLVIEAMYIVDQVPAGSPSCLYITQRYEFHRTQNGDNCEPDASLPCARWKPIVSYRFIGRNGGESLTSINIAQRQHRTVDENAFNSVGLFRDSDLLEFTNGVFMTKYNPLFVEWRDRVVLGGKQTKQWDNVHQTFKGVIEEPTIGIDFNNILSFGEPGCPECLHSHWRWGTLASLVGKPEGRGNLIGIPAGSNQDLELSVVNYSAGEEDPDSFADLVQDSQLIRTYNTSGRNPLQIYRDSAPEDVVYWQSATGHQNSDTFFAYGAFFDPTLLSQQLYDRSQSISSMSEEDGISSIVTSRLYSVGSTTIDPFMAALAWPLPPGYGQYAGVSYDVSTTAVTSGPNTLTFSVQSVADQATFDGLRIFHLEQDPYDPGAVIWVDRTVLAPDP